MLAFLRTQSCWNLSKGNNYHILMTIVILELPSTLAIFFFFKFTFINFSYFSNLLSVVLHWKCKRQGMIQTSQSFTTTIDHSWLPSERLESFNFRSICLVFIASSMWARSQWIISTNAYWSNIKLCKFENFKNVNTLF